MNTLINQIKQDQLAARKLRNAHKASILTTLLGEAQSIGKKENRETTDEEVVEVVNKFIKNIDFTLAQDINEMDRMGFMLEKAVLDWYRPKQITAEQMFEIVKKLRAVKGSLLELKHIMQHFKTQFPGMYDGKVLSTVAKEYIEAQV